MNVKKNLMLWVAVFALALPLILAGTASAKYLYDGAKRTDAGGWAPVDGYCVNDSTKLTRTDCRTVFFSAYEADKATCEGTLYCTDSSFSTGPTCTGAGFNWITEREWNATGAVGEKCRGLFTYKYYYGASGDAGYRNGCLRCHSNEYGTHAVGGYMKTGHKNMQRPITVGKPWLGPDGNQYEFARATTNPIDWNTGKINVSGVDYDMVLLVDGWLPGAPDVFYWDGTNVKRTGSTSNGYSCGSCHSTGYVGAVGAAGAEPLATLTARFGATDGATIASKMTGTWDQWGIMCSRCHKSNDTSTVTSSNPTLGTGDAGGISRHYEKGTILSVRAESEGGTGAKATALCAECHRQAASGTVGLAVGDNHGVFGFTGHSISNQYLKSAHGDFAGDYTEIGDKTKYSTTGFMNLRAGSVVATQSGGGCVACHDVHESVVLMEEGDPAHAHAIKHCQDCHSNTAPLGATPGIDVQKIQHPAGSAGTPVGLAGTNPSVACEICHMPQGLHLWRISTNATYTLFTGTAGAAPVDADGKVKVDIDLACGQCHGGSSTTTHNGAMYLSKATLARYAKGMHGVPALAIAPTASFTTPVVSLGTRVTITDTSIFDPAATAKVTVNWGDGTTGVISAGTATYHDYSTARVRSYVVTLTASDGANPVSKASARVAVPQKLSAGGTTLTSARVTLKIDGHVRKVVVSNSTTGAFSFGNIPYCHDVVIHVYKSGVASPPDIHIGCPVASDGAISIL